MIRFASQFFDRVAINWAAKRMPRPDGRDLHLAEAEQFLIDVDFSPSAGPPPELAFNGDNQFHFTSPFQTPYAVNNTVKGRLYRCDDSWQTKPVVLLLHGWNDTLNHRYYYPRHAAAFNRIGISAVTMTMPWQFERRPRELGAWGNFLSADLLHTNEAILQAVRDVQALVAWLRAQGVPFVGLWGVSLGSLIAGLVLCHDPRIDTAVLMVPVARLKEMIEEVAFCEPIKNALGRRNIDLTKINLVSKRPAIDKKKILLIKAEYDLFVAPQSVEDLWQAWGQPEIWRFRQGHISVLWEPGLSTRLIRWIAANAGVPVAK